MEIQAFTLGNLAINITVHLMRQGKALWKNSREHDPPVAQGN